MLPRQLKDASTLQSLLKTKPERYWEKRGEQMALKLFHDMAERVPAYKKFLHSHQLDHTTIKTIKDFEQHVPLIDKDNYLRVYKREELCWDGVFAESAWVVSTTSGSTGKPFYFPRTDLQDKQYALIAELYLRENFDIQNKKTLYINAFAMGAWIGGLFTYEAVKQVAEKGYNLTIISPGINKNEVLSSVRELGGDFDQVIIGCYPPIMKDIIDQGIAEGITWGDYNLGIVFSAEGFSEEFRDYIANNAHLRDIYSSTLNHYGTVDLGTMSHETPMSIALRRLTIADKALYAHVFGDTIKLPTLTQYIPELFYFEAVNNQLVCSSNSGLPLVRYDLKDHGGVTTLANIERFYGKKTDTLRSNLTHDGLYAQRWNLPYVYVYERSDFSVTLVGGNIFPEEIRRALLDNEIQKYLSGKFTMEVVQDKAHNSKLVVHVELRKDVERNRSIIQLAQKLITKILLEENSEYASNYASYGRKLIPQVRLWPNEHPVYFAGKGKQRWTKK